MSEIFCEHIDIDDYFEVCRDCGVDLSDDYAIEQEYLAKEQL